MSAKNEKKKCSGHAAEPQMFAGVRACRNAGKVQRDGRWYCTTHDPVAKAERAKKRSEEREAAWNARQRAWDRQRFIEERRDEAVEVLRHIVQQGANAENLHRAVEVLDQLDELYDRKAAS